jgi:YHS domain-containing protein
MGTEYLIFGWRSGHSHGLLARVISLRTFMPALAGWLLIAAPGTAAATGATPAPRVPAQPQHFYAPVYKKEPYGTAMSINDRCPVKHGPLNKNIRPSYVNRQTVGYCCHGCPPIFTEDPGHFLEMMKISVPDPVDPRRVASYDPKLRIFLNQEAYFFAGPDTKKRFESDPLRYAGPLTDPVSQKAFTATHFSPHMKFKDRTYYFESQLTERQFAVSPKNYSTRREE